MVKVTFLRVQAYNFLRDPENQHSFEGPRGQNSFEGPRGQNSFRSPGVQVFRVKGVNFFERPRLQVLQGFKGSKSF